MLGDIGDWRLQPSFLGHIHFFVPLLNRVEDLYVLSLSCKKLSAVASETTEQTHTVTQANSPSLTGETWKEKPVI